METARMNYYFTGLLILALTILALFVEPAYPRKRILKLIP
jgi:Na+-transporting NADH:ubiquinone oxidoreductase subunit NqrB